MIQPFNSSLVNCKTGCSNSFGQMERLERIRETKKVKLNQAMKMKDNFHRQFEILEDHSISTLKER